MALKETLPQRKKQKVKGKKAKRTRDEAENMKEQDIKENEDDDN